MAYRWISALMPVTNSSIATDNGSTRKPMSTWRLPAGIQVKMVFTTERSSAPFESRSSHTPSVTTKAAAGIRKANQPAAGSPRRRPTRTKHDEAEQG